jgi:hypothetical protein
MARDAEEDGVEAVAAVGPVPPTHLTHPTQRAEGPTHPPSLAHVFSDASYGGQARPTCPRQTPVDMYFFTAATVFSTSACVL